jgi:hypothetical protein
MRSERLGAADIRGGRRALFCLSWKGLNPQKTKYQKEKEERNRREPHKQRPEKMVACPYASAGCDWRAPTEAGRNGNTGGNDDGDVSENNSSSPSETRWLLAAHVDECEFREKYQQLFIERASAGNVSDRRSSTTSKKGEGEPPESVYLWDTLKGAGEAVKGGLRVVREELAEEFRDLRAAAAARDPERELSPMGVRTRESLETSDFVSELTESITDVKGALFDAVSDLGFPRRTQGGQPDPGPSAIPLRPLTFEGNLPAGWAAFERPDGFAVFVNVSTGETREEPPVAPAIPVEEDVGLLDVREGNDGEDILEFFPLESNSPVPEENFDDYVL